MLNQEQYEASLRSERLTDDLGRFQGNVIVAISLNFLLEGIKCLSLFLLAFDKSD